MSLLLLGGLAVAGIAVWNTLKDDSSDPTSWLNQISGSQPSSPRPSVRSRRHAVARSSTRPRPAKASPATGGGWLAQCGSGSVPTGGATTIYDHNGMPLHLSAADELASGGEGTVYRCPGHDSFVIKLYKRDIVENPEKQKAVAERLRDMLSIEALKKDRDIAWPQRIVYDADKRVAGFVMRAVEGSSFRSLQGATQIQRLFPGWNRKDLALVARNFLYKMQLLADHGVLVNDFNPANFIVGKDHRVRLIDCDSFQIPSANGDAPHVTTTYFASHSAPELLRDPSLLKRPRGPEQARFGAAIIVFQLLMCGLHPYSHKNGGTPEGNLKAGQCPIWRNKGAEIPEGWANLLSYFPLTMTESFVKMFRDGHHNPSMRPTLANLRTEVEKFLHVMEQDPIRKSLSPCKPKSKVYHGTKKNSAA